MIIHSENETKKKHRFMSTEAETTNRHLGTNNQEELKQKCQPKAFSNGKGSMSLALIKC